MGRYNTAKSAYETVIGRYNTDYTPNDTAGWDYSDRLFVVANGTSNTSRNDALVITKDGTQLMEPLRQQLLLAMALD